MKILHLVLKKKWYDMIESGEKGEEYRDNTEYWTKRLTEVRMDTDGQYKVLGKKFDAVCFRNGYSKVAPRMMFECRGIEFGKGIEPWGAEAGKYYHVIRLGYKIS